MAGVAADYLNQLHSATPADRIKTRPGPGGSKPLSYVDARYVMDKLDELGPENWQDRYEDRDGGSVRCGIGINVDGEWIWKWDVGTESNIEEDKGAYSDAFKRAAVKWGIARDLYGNGSHPVNGTGRAAQPSPQAVSSPARPAADDPYGDSLDEFPSILKAECPIHHKPWTDKGKGKFCTGKMPDGSWCKERP